VSVAVTSQSQSEYCEHAIARDVARGVAPSSQSHISRVNNRRRVSLVDSVVGWLACESTVRQQSGAARIL